MAGGIHPFRVLVGKLDFTIVAENLTFSNVDPGGHEICSFDVQAGRADAIQPGDRVQVMDGLGVVWDGRVAEPSKAIKRGWGISHKVGTASTRISAEGAGAATKDNEVSFIWVDQDLSHWGAWGIKRQIALINSGFATQIFSSQLSASANDSPALQISAQGQIVGEAIYESYYDAGALNTVAEVTMTAAPIGYANPDANNVLKIFGSSDNNDSNEHDLTSYGGAGSVTIDWISSVNQRFVGVRHVYNQAQNAFFGNTNGVYGWYLQSIAVYGPHGLAKQGTAPAGLFTSDIARHVATLALSAGAPLKIGQFDAITNYVVPHYVQYSRVEHEQVLSDMAKLAPAHYGVWESSSIFDDRPEITFRAYSVVPNIFISLSDCDEVDISERLADLYTQAEITFNDPTGLEYIITVQLPNAVLDRSGIGRTFSANLGLSTRTAASVFGSFVLQALFAQSRSGGSVTLPTSVRNANGAGMPSYRLKSGIDRIRIADLPTRQGPLLSYDTDGFRISRVECNVDEAGLIQTRIEVDTGPQLVDTLTSRVQIASTLGASI